MKTVDLHGYKVHDAWKTFIAFAYEKNICSKETVFKAYDGPHEGFVLHKQ